MNLAQFQTDLTVAICAAINRSRDRFLGDTLTCLALDIHPYHGFLNLCMRTSDDDADVPFIHNWKHSDFAECWGSLNWPEAMPISTAMEMAYVNLRKHCSDGNDSTLCWPFFIASARALQDKRIRSSLDGLVQSETFSFFIGDPDDNSSRINYCQLATALDLARIQI